MVEKKYQVFISSTYSDLIEERRKILDILLMADCIPAGMESFVASDSAQFETIKKVIDLCDYYVLIIGKRYGSINQTTGLSYTEMEYEYAKEKGIPVLAFIIDDSIELPAEKIENELDKIEKLKLFKEKAMTNRLVSVWKTRDELTGILAIAIMRAKSEIIRPGWQRATNYDEASLRRTIMDLEDNNSDLESKLKSANDSIQSFSKQYDLAFENYNIGVEYRYTSNNSSRNGKKDIELTTIFSVIATQMMDVMITEEIISDVLKKHLFSTSYGYIFNDDQLIKRLLNQFKGLGLLISSWDKEKSFLFWGLTSKGEKVRNDTILIKNTN